MINAWSLAAEILEGTFDETYPIIKENTSRKSSVTDEGCEDNSDSKH